MLKQQMDMFEEGGLKDQGGSVDPISGNDVPIGSTKEEVRDDIPAQLSEGEFVLPADVVRFHGLEKIMALRDEAKAGLSKMEDMGQMGNSEEATIPDDTPFSMEDLDMEDEEEYNSEETKEPAMAQGGLAYAPGGLSTNTNTLGSQTSQFANTASRTQPKAYKPPPIPTAAPSGGFKYGTNTGKAEGKATFDKLIGGVAADEYKTYVNDAGAEIQVPFKNGQMLTGYTLPEGYRPKSKKVESAKLKSTRVKSARPNNDNNENPDPRDNLTTTTLGGEIDSRGNVIKGTTYGIGYDIPGLNLASGVGAYFMAGMQLAMGNPPKGTTVTLSHLDATGLPTGSKVTGIDYQDWKTARTANGKISITNPKAQTLNNIIKASADFDAPVIFKDLRNAYGTEEFRAEQTRNQLDSQKFIDDSDYTPTQDTSVDETVAKGDLGTIVAGGIQYDDPVNEEGYNDVTPTSTSTSLSNMTANNDDEDNNTGGGFSSGSNTGGFEDSFMGTYKGSLITRRQPSKKKKMKRGGLASRK